MNTDVPNAFRHEWPVPTARDPGRTIIVTLSRDGEGAIIRIPGYSSWSVKIRKDFEVIHGVSRIVRLIPDKLATAIAIANERLPHDGSYLVQIVSDLLATFREKAAKTHPAGNHDDDMLLDCLDDLKRRLEAFDVALRARKPIPVLKEAAKNDVDVCDRIFQMCHAFLDFVHPTSLALKIEGPERFEERALKTAEVLETFYRDNEDLLSRELQGLLSAPGENDDGNA